jgi:hypothetical protein
MLIVLYAVSLLILFRDEKGLDVSFTTSPIDDL